MAERQLKTRIAIRRDTEANYSSTFKPLKGEILLVDTANYGMRVKVGDGNKTFANIDYADKNNNVVLNGYYLNEKFYTDSTYQVELEKVISKIYIDKNAHKLYIFDENSAKYICVDEMIPNASAATAGIMKLYTGEGYNEDGTMTQKAITEGIDEVVFAISDTDAECLVLNKPW